MKLEGPIVILTARILCFLVILCGGTFTATAATQTTYYVSPAGSDSNPGTLDLPFQTITKARDVVRTVNTNMSGDIYVYLRGGTYNITSTITFGPQDSGTNGYRIYYQAYAGETPVLNGATKVTGWTQHNGNIWKATLNHTTKLRTLIVNDKRAYMASKNVNCQGSWGTYNITAGQGSWAWISGSKPDGAKYNTGDVAALANPEDVEIINSTTWNQNIVCVREITTEGSSRILKFQQPTAAIGMNQTSNAGFAASGSHRIQNAYEFLDTAGEFYFNKATATLYYYKGSEDLSTAVVYAPKIRTLIDISGTSKTNRVKNITFKGITFANTEAELPQVNGSSGKVSVQSSTWCIAFANSNLHADKYRAYDVMLGGIDVTSADSIDFIENTIKHIGNEGISLINDVSNCTILGNAITDIGGSGIQIGHPQHLYEGDGGTHEKYAPDVEGICRNNVIKNNYIFSTTNIYLGHQGITAYFVDSLTIEHNHIEGTNYGGVSVGWGWCNFDSTAVPGNPTNTAKNNKFNYNRVFDCMKTLSDSGAYYTLGSQPNSQASYNYVKASTTHFQGVYHPDEGTAGYTGNNLVFDIVPGQDNFELNDWGRKHDNHYDNIYTTSSAYQIGAPNCTVTNLHVYSSSAGFPQAAKDIINSAGLEPAYQYLLPGNTTPTPTSTPTQTPTPTPTQISTPTPVMEPIWTGGPYTFNGTDTYIDLPDRITGNLSDFSVACRVNLNTVTNWVRIFDFGGDTNIFMMLTPQSGTSGYPYFAITTTGNDGEQGLNGKSALATGTWQHLAVVKNGTTGILYINGQEVDRNTAMTLKPLDLGETLNNYLGRSQWSHDPYLDGSIKEFKIYNRAITAAEVTALYNGGDLTGDVNGDGNVTIVDAMLIAQFAAGLDPAGFIAANADVNCDAKININDALAIARYAAGLLNNLGC
jgi:hypothetical protein